MKKNVIRLTESELKNYIRKVIKEQAQAKTPDLESIKSQVVGKKIQLTVDGKLQGSAYSNYFTKKSGEVLTTFLVDSVTVSGTQVVLTGRDLSTIDARGNNQTAWGDVSQFKVQTLTWKGCQDPYYLVARGVQGNYMNGQAKEAKAFPSMIDVTNKTLTDILFNASSCAPDIDDEKDFTP